MSIALSSGRTDSKSAHPITNFSDQNFRDALLHQQTRPCAADLSLVEPDPIDQALDALSRSASSNTMNGDFPPNSRDSRLWLVVAARIARPTSVEPVKAILSRSGCLTSASPVEPSPVTMLTTPGGQRNFLANLTEQQRRQGSEFRGLQDDSISGSERRRNLPRQHEQREIPGNDLSNDSTRHVIGKFLLDQLRPSGMMIKMPRHQRNIDVTALANRLAIVHRLEHRE